VLDHANPAQGSKTSTFGPKFGVFDCPVQPLPPPLLVA